LVSPMSLIRSY